MDHGNILNIVVAVIGGAIAMVGVYGWALEPPNELEQPPAVQADKL